MVLLRRTLPMYTSIRNHQVTVLGSATEIGQTLCLLLRQQPNITKLVVHDTLPQTLGVSLDLFHVPSNNTIQAYVGEDTLKKSLENSEVVIAAGGLVRKPGISENLWSTSNIDFIRSLAKVLAKVKPMPFVGIVTEPINIVVPMAAEIMRTRGELDPKKLFGITTLDVLRARSLYAARYNLDARKVYIPVIGGRSDKTCIPLLSQVKPFSNLDSYKAHDFTMRLRNADENVIKAKNGFSPMVSVAYSALLFTRSVLDALDGNKASVNALVENNDFGTAYFSGLVHIDSDGVKEMQRYPKLSYYECNLLQSTLDHLRKDVLKGKKIIEYA